MAEHLVAWFITGAVEYLLALLLKKYKLIAWVLGVAMVVTAAGAATGTILAGRVSSEVVATVQSGHTW